MKYLNKKSSYKYKDYPLFCANLDLLQGVKDKYGERTDKRYSFKAINLPFKGIGLHIPVQGVDNVSVSYTLFITEASTELYDANVYFEHTRGVCEVKFTIFADREGSDSVTFNISDFSLNNPIGSEYSAAKDIADLVLSMFLMFNHALNKRKDIREAKGIKRVFSGKGGFKQLRPITITYIDSVQNIQEGNAQRNVEWSHAWKVRGHWRYYSKKDTIGKDRLGAILYGRTWVKPYTKQSQLELVDKTRVLK